MILYDLFLDVIDIIIFLPCLVYLHKEMDKLLSPLPFKAYRCLPWTFGSICSKSLVV